MRKPILSVKEKHPVKNLFIGLGVLVVATLGLLTIGAVIEPPTEQKTLVFSDNSTLLDMAIEDFVALKEFNYSNFVIGADTVFDVVVDLENETIFLMFLEVNSGSPVIVFAMHVIEEKHVIKVIEAQQYIVGMGQVYSNDIEEIRYVVDVIVNSFSNIPKIEEGNVI